MTIAVVGAGIVGLVTAYELLRAGKRVVVLEKGTVGCGCSGKGLGLLVSFHEGVRGGMAKVQRESVKLWPELIESVAKDAGVAVGSFYRVWDAGGQLRVPGVMEVLGRAIVARGAEIREGVEVTDVEALAGEYEAVVLACGVGNGVGGIQMEGKAGQGVRLAACGWDGFVRDRNERGGFYVVSDWDGTVLVGSHGFEEERDVADEAVTRQMVVRAVGLVPALAGVAVVRAWVGNRPTTKPLLPLVRPVGERVVAVTGLGKLGFCLAPGVAGEVKRVIGLTG